MSYLYLKLYLLHNIFISERVFTEIAR